MAKIDLVTRDWADIVFEGRNQSYGAYQLRTNTSKRNVMSILLVVAAGILGYLALNLYRTIEANRQLENTQVVELSALDKKKEAKKVEKEVVKVEPEKQVEKVKSSVKFTPPVIKKDEEVKEENQLDLEKVEKTNITIGAFDVEGNDEKGQGRNCPARASQARGRDQGLRRRRADAFVPRRTRCPDAVAQQQHQVSGDCSREWCAGSRHYPVRGGEGRFSFWCNGRQIGRPVARQGSTARGEVHAEVDSW